MKLLNLRYGSQTQNMLNRTTPALSKTGARGVYRNGRGFNAQICVNRKTLCLGTFKTVAEASRAVERVREMHLDA